LVKVVWTRRRELRILVVDDDENIREILKDLLTMSGHQVFLSSNGEEALDIFVKQDPDLIFTDLGMPGISGWEVNRRIKEINPDKPVVIISGWGTQISEEDMRNSKVDMILPKPFSLDQITQVASMFEQKMPSSRAIVEVIT
jgi:CheY-like chemotaxis protein